MGEINRKKTYFLNKKDRVIGHLKKCINFIKHTTLEKRQKVFDLSNDESTKQSSSLYDAITTSSQLSTQKTIVRFSSSFGLLDNYIVCPLSQENYEKFKVLLLRLTIACGWAFNWINKPEAYELPSLKVAISEYDMGIYKALHKDFVAMDISAKRENYLKVIEKTEDIIDELKNINLQKTLNMCKLKAAMAWEHSHRPAFAKLFLPIFQNKNITKNNDEPNISNISHEESSEEPNESVDDENDEILELTSLKEFGQFLDI
ncbi:3338_t:CDS:2 [Cetraspora pellucida]|uniref:3338_t:CDS:1 n=1 Tax=Cetraspora pellucida TaxID=1433469 RepID=A0A9N9H9P2_9GLOM|nr:3338_t:CDS:2 [Cetraspora pellucida]